MTDSQFLLCVEAKLFQLELDEKKIAGGQQLLTFCFTDNKKVINPTCFNKSNSITGSFTSGHVEGYCIGEYWY